MIGSPCSSPFLNTYRRHRTVGFFASCGSVYTRVTPFTVLVSAASAPERPKSGSIGGGFGSSSSSRAASSRPYMAAESMGSSSDSLFRLNPPGPPSPSSICLLTAATPRRTAAAVPLTTQVPEPFSMSILQPVSSCSRRMVSPPLPMTRPSDPSHAIDSSASNGPLGGTNLPPPPPPPPPLSPASAMTFFTAAEPRMTCSVVPDTTHSPAPRSMDILAPLSSWSRRMVSPPLPMMRPSYPAQGMASSASALTRGGPGGGRIESRPPRGGDRRRRRGDRDLDRDLEFPRDLRR